MKKKDLLAILSGFGDDDELLVEGGAGFDEPAIYVTATRPRRPTEFVPGQNSEYVADREGTGCVIIATSQGCTRM